MKIQIFVQSLSVGGAERVAAMWANGFVVEGHEVEIVLYQSETFPRTYAVDSRVNICSVHSNIKGRVPNFISRFRKTGAVIKQFRPNVIITVYHVQDLPIWYYTRGTNTRIISTEHNAFERPKNAQMSRRDYILKFYINRLFDIVTVLTQADAKYIGKRLKHVTVLPNPLSYIPLETVPVKEKVILACGRIDVWYTKGFDLLIEAWAKIRSRYPDWCLTIVGDGSPKSKNAMMEMAEKNCLTDAIGRGFKLLGWQDNMQPLYQKSEIFVLSSRFEGFGMVLTEAMSQGCACIACDYKGRQAEVIGNEGFIVPMGDSGVIANAIAHLIESPEHRHRLQLAAIQRSRVFMLNNIMTQWRRILCLSDGS